ncbi:biotin--acetyl-CoA-carboxylase ligase [Borreliella burgdorferi]|uniref:BlyB family putative holin accessory protein n=1 Tax=Borreliella TaxID=64895 RepID=UPI00017F3A6E|nr:MULTISPECIES: BlyB family putative holin accessory protein [Borreliella]ADQ30023.1 BlyB protein family protein [Borreliella burgdorferi N40]MCD2318024.1 biotin--acetyl-CoA-carboxylase ligase [Borreliella burgdorferi]MCD2320920.1 biotin--acetyl-CoA-carboxylase ligase [Borreliella burgdorferi]MCD2376723.1 biotin--acetyl-CoA-carboxylase ligase [Borreliella burgdorferi]MCD2377184.1 biotin--acetyl-CoA-carboxylase ligase [Borreliella burgdorferi]
MKLSKDNLEIGLTSISKLIEIFSKFEDEFDPIAHKGFSLVHELYAHYTSIYKANMERIENASTLTIAKTLAPINEKINQCIDLVNSNEKNLKISNNLKFNEEGIPIYQEGVNNAK